jgi:hypothetical protein
MKWKCAFLAASSPHVILGAQPHRYKQMGTSSQNTPPYCYYDSLYIL